MTKLKIVLADDHGVVRDGLKLLINSQSDLEVVGEATDGQAALEMISRLVPDVAVLDISMPLLNGIELVKQLKARGVTSKLLALTANEDREYMQVLLKQGAVGYLLKRSAASDLLQAIRTVAAGGRYLDPAVIEDVVGGLFASFPKHPGAVQELLSDRERDVLRMIAQGYTNKEIGTRLDISAKTVESYKSRAIQKTGLRGRAEIVRYSLEQGWLKKD